MLFSLLFPSLLFITIKLKSITLPLEARYGTFTIPIGIGNNPVKGVNLNLESDRMYQINLFIEDSEISVINKIETVKLDTTEAKAQKVKAKIYLDKNKTIFIKEYPLYNIVVNSFSYFDNLPLAYKFRDEDYSIIHRLYKEEMISYRAFTLNMNFANNSGNISFGPFTEKDLKSIKFKVDESFPSWGSNMKSLSIGDVQIDINDYFMFQARYQMLFFPYPLFNALKDNIFKEYLANDICFMILYIEGKGISCNCSVKEKIQPLIFNFE